MKYKLSKLVVAFCLIVLSVSLLAGSITYAVPAPDTPSASEKPTTLPKAAEAAPFGANTNSVECPGGIDGGNCAATTSFWFPCGEKGISQNTKVGIACLLRTTINFLAAIVGIAATIGIIIGGIMYSTAGSAGLGDPKQAKKGTTYITNSVIAVILYFLMYAAITFLIPAGAMW